MKSSGKRSTEVKLSLCKRTQSTSKLVKTNFFLRDAPEPVSLLKSSTLRMMPVR
jgi:hypothetical protein